MVKRKGASAAKPDRAADAEISKAILGTVTDPLVSEILTETTRRSRKALLVAALVSYTVTWGGLFPEEIEAFGFKVAELQRVNLLYVLALVSSYFLVAFAAYCYSDTRLRKVKLRLGQLSAVEPMEKVTPRLEDLRTGITAERAREADSELAIMASLSGDTDTVKDVHKAAFARQLVDIFLPMLVGLGSIAVVVKEAGRLPGLQVAVVFVVIILVLIVAGVLQSEKYRNFKKLLPMRRTVSDMSKAIELLKKQAGLPPRSLRARFIGWRLRRTQFGSALTNPGRKKEPPNEPHNKANEPDDNP